MKKLIYTFAIFCGFTFALQAQDNAKQEAPKQTEPKANTKDTTKKSSGGTRMAISNKGVQTKGGGTVKSSSAKTSETSGKKEEKSNNNTTEKK